MTQSFHLVQSRGILHGLPSYEDRPKLENLVALVTGATGVSGYSLVKVLAASKRWKRIYCMSSRPPPSNFFEDLGGDGDRVEHIMVDFLAGPSAISSSLVEKIQSVDHIFYCSYMQPAPGGKDALDLWANEAESRKINVSLFANFLSGLKEAGLRPRRVLLQTGTKYYGFYLGPANIPAFESDPRVQIGDNFYYEQEDALAAYCRSVGASWSVARPSYIVGAVRDGFLNHLIGMGIYAAVQAHRGGILSFPGDYCAWDREQLQSTASLNAHFEEWLVLTDATANEAFNIHDGLSFTWGRLWPMLARWYGIKWSPPEADTSKYRVVTLPNPQTPRGHGPQATLRSTFSLLEWSLKPEVGQAWRELTSKHDLVLDPFDDRYRARIFSFADSAIIGDGAMTMSMRKARQFGFFGTVDSYHAIFNALHDLAKLKLIVQPCVDKFVE